ncbi:MAG: hypothetical protein LBI84_01185, partial [Propionibacteriaceae bacterium]|nr:hypothetical protein [Propionibacteriaceae bacterium]
MELPSQVPQTIADAVGLRVFAAYLRNPRRSRPVVLLTIPRGADQPLVDLAEVVQTAQGRADVVVVPTGPLTFGLADALGKQAIAFGGACRVYPAGSAWLADPRSVPLRQAYDDKGLSRFKESLLEDLRQEIRRAAAPAAARPQPKRLLGRTAPALTVPVPGPARLPASSGPAGGGPAPAAPVPGPVLSAAPVPPVPGPASSAASAPPVSRSARLPASSGSAVAAPAAVAPTSAVSNPAAPVSEPASSAAPVASAAGPARGAAPSGSAAHAPLAAAPILLTAADSGVYPVGTRSEALWLGGYLTTAARGRTAVVVTRASGRAEAYVNAPELAESLDGVADVFEVTNAATAWSLTEMLPEDGQVYGGMTRVYPPGMAWTADPDSAPLRLAFSFAERKAATQDVVSQTLRVSAPLRDYHTSAAGRPANRTLAVAGEIIGLAAGRALVRLDGGGLGVIWPELVADTVPPERLFAKGMKV